jgi:hypothetical protein
MTLNFGLLLFALRVEQPETSTAMLNALRTYMVKVLFMLNTLFTFHLVCSPLR